ncbi:MAG: DUF1285 domain-containing protein [Pseudomonadota bacterium]
MTATPGPSISNPVTDLSRLAASLSDAGGDQPLPVDQWHPTHCGAMDLVIKDDGSWWHEGTPMTRPQLVRLFSRILRRDDDAYVLVTPAEKVTITVDDVPFIAVDFDRHDEGLVFVTNVGDRVLLSKEHPIALRRSKALGHDAPYLHVRGGLEARLSRAAYYRLIDETGAEDGDEAVVIESAGARFALPIVASDA